MDKIDIMVIGAGVIGLATAAELSRQFPDGIIGVLDKEQQFGWHTSSRNSEVIHGGMYYPTGSLKAKLCAEGNRLLYEYCDKHKIPYQKLGKLIIAPEESDIPVIEGIAKQGAINGVEDLVWLDKEAVAAMEPHIKAVTAIYSPSTGVIDSHKLMASFESTVKQNRNAFICYRHEVTGIEYNGSEYIVTFTDPDGTSDQLACTWLINCAGLWSDRISSYLGLPVEELGYKIHWVKGEYFSLSPSKSKLLTHLIYPPPLKALKGLGTHVTKSLDGKARLGPSAFYVDDINYDVDPSHKEEFFASASAYLPFLTRDDIMADFSGIRPKLQSPTDSVKDFVIRHERERGFPGYINLCGIESPGLTACLAIGRMAAGFVNSI